MDPNQKQQARQRRHVRVRKRVQGTAERPRLSVYRSNAQIYAQLIDDEHGHTMAAASSLENAVDKEGATKSAVARQVGELVARRARDSGVSRAVFDRGGFRYMGRVQALAEGAREAGLEF